MFIRWVPPVVVVVVGILAGPALAVPPPGAAVGATNVPMVSGQMGVGHASTGSPAAITHVVARGERLINIAHRYGVSVEDLSGWNGIDVKRPTVHEGQELRVLVPPDAAQRQRRVYQVRPGDTWAKLARRFGVDEDKLRRHWNPGQNELRAGDRVTLWVVDGSVARDAATPPARAVDAKPQPVVVYPNVEPLLVSTVSTVSRVVPGPLPAPEPTVQPRYYPMISVPPSALSIGTPGHGRLKNGIQLPVNDALYTIRNPDHSWCSSHMIEYLQRALSSFRQTTGFEREILIQDVSQRGGGHFQPHLSHRQGRDVDIQLPLRAGAPPRTVPSRMGLVDWDATWELVKSFAATGGVKYIFLSRSRQMELYRAAKRSGASEEEVRQYLQYPRGSRFALVRHSAGHVKHFHVRFTCAPYEHDCHD
jgi:murein endopeptidase/LysM repeat protein